MKHRNSQKRFYGNVFDENLIYYIVSKTQDNFPYFKETIFCDVFIENLKICKELQGFKLYGFSIIYDHVNLMIEPSKKYNISKVMQSIKKNVSQDINKILGIYCKGENADSRFHRVELDLHTKNFIDKYGVYDFSLTKNERKTLSLQQTEGENPYSFCKDGGMYPFPKFQWKQSFYDHYIRDDLDFENHFDYTLNNPAKHELPDDWLYTSLNYIELIDV